MTDTSLLVTSYATLQAAAGTHFLNRTDLVTAVPLFIQLCEARMRRMMRSRHTSLLQAALAAGDTSITLPAHLVEVLGIAISSPVADATPLRRVSYDTLQQHLRENQTADTPEYVTVIGDEMFFAPIPDKAYTLDVEVEGPFVPLSDAAPTNWVLDDYPDVYLYGTLAESAPYLREDARVAVWDSRFVAAMQELEKARDRWRFPGPLTPKLPTNNAGW